MNHHGLIYNQRKRSWLTLEDFLNKPEELIDSLMVYSYDSDVAVKKIRHLNNNRPIGFISLNLKNTGKSNLMGRFWAQIKFDSQYYELW